MDRLSLLRKLCALLGLFRVASLRAIDPTELSEMTDTAMATDPTVMITEYTVSVASGLSAVINQISGGWQVISTIDDYTFDWEYEDYFSISEARGAVCTWDDDETAVGCTPTTFTSLIETLAYLSSIAADVTSTRTEVTEVSSTVQFTTTHATPSYTTALITPSSTTAQTTTTSSSSSEATTSPLETVSQVASWSSTSTASTSSMSTRGGVSAGTLAGAVVGSGVFMFIAACGIFFVFKLRRKRRADPPSYCPGTDNEVEGATGRATETKMIVQRRPKLEADWNSASMALAQQHGPGLTRAAAGFQPMGASECLKAAELEATSTSCELYHYRDPEIGEAKGGHELDGGRGMSQWDRELWFNA